jgi:murein DD-endopeptidase MepM/ murein hydrolase activator NlpD
MRRHNGVDYSASRGTPVRSTGDGKIIYRGRKGGYGKTVIIRHGGKFSTLYAHMNSYRRGLRTGKSVKQGDIIGYVGSTGLATGPHLHYEFRVHGVHKNPLKVSYPAASPIKSAYRDDFEQHAKGLLHELAQLEQSTTVAANN